MATPPKVLPADAITDWTAPAGKSPATPAKTLPASAITQWTAPASMPKETAAQAQAGGSWTPMTTGERIESAVKDEARRYGRMVEESPILNTLSLGTGYTPPPSKALPGTSPPHGNVVTQPVANLGALVPSSDPATKGFLSAVSSAESPPALATIFAMGNVPAIAEALRLPAAAVKALPGVLRAGYGLGFAQQTYAAIKRRSQLLDASSAAQDAGDQKRADQLANAAQQEWGAMWGNAAMTALPPLVEGTYRLTRPNTESAMLPRLTENKLSEVGKAVVADPDARRGISAIYHAFNSGSPDLLESLAEFAPRIKEAQMRDPVDFTKKPSWVKGGTDWRMGAVRQQIGRELDYLWQVDREPQIRAHYDAPGVRIGNAVTDMDGSTVATLSRRLRTSVPLDQMSDMTIGEADAMLHKVNAAVRGLHNATPSELAALKLNNPAVDGLFSLKKALVDGIGDRLRELGEPGTKEFDREYAAGSRLQEALWNNQKASEGVQPGLLGRTRFRMATMLGMPKPDFFAYFGKGSETPGDLLERGYTDIAKSRVQPGSWMQYSGKTIAGAKALPASGMLSYPASGDIYIPPDIGAPQPFSQRAIAGPREPTQAYNVTPGGTAIPVGATITELPKEYGSTPLYGEVQRSLPAPKPASNFEEAMAGGERVRRTAPSGAVPVEGPTRRISEQFYPKPMTPEEKVLYRESEAWKRLKDEMAAREPSVNDKRRAWSLIQGSKQLREALITAQRTGEPLDATPAEMTVLKRLGVLNVDGTVRRLRSQP